MKLPTEACVGGRGVGGQAVMYVDCFPCAGDGKGGLTVMLVTRVEGLFRKDAVRACCTGDEERGCFGNVGWSFISMYTIYTSHPCSWHLAV